MADRLKQLRVEDPVLTKVAQGYTNAQFIGTQIFPVVPTAKEGGKIPQFGKESFKIYNTLRSIRSKRSRVDLGYGAIEYALAEHSVEIPVDDREKEEATKPIQPEINATKAAMDIILLGHEHLAGTLAQDEDTYEADHVVTLAGGDQWSDHDNSDPINDIEEGKEKIRESIARRPNLLVLGAKVYAALKHHPKLVGRIKYSQKGVVTPQLMATLFDVDEVLIGEAVYADDDGKFHDIWGKNAMLFWVPKAVALGTPAFGYTLRKEGRPKVFKYRDESVNSDIVVAEDIYTVKVTGPLAGYLIKNAVA